MYRRLSKNLASRAFSSAPPDVVPPLRRHRTATSVLEALSRSTGRALSEPHVSRDTYFQSVRPSVMTREYLQKGRDAAQFFVKRGPNLFSKFHFSQPQTSVFQPTYTAENVGEDSEPALERLITVMEATAAHNMFQRLTDDGARPEAVSRGVRLRLLELLAASTGALSLNIRPSQFVVSDPLSDDHSESWEKAEKLFATFEGDERTKETYQAMIRGAADLSSNERALQLYAEMRGRDMQPDLPTFNALFSAAGAAQEGPWTAVLRLYEDLLTAGREPDTESFNAMLRVLKEQNAQRLLAVLEEMRLRRVRPNIGTAAALLFAIPNVKSHLVTKATVGVLDQLLASPGRLEISHYWDLNFSNAVLASIHSLRFPLLMRLDRLYAHSPNLWLKDDNARFFLTVLLKRITAKYPEAALRFYTEHIANQNIFGPIFKLKFVGIFVTHHPDSLDLIMNDVLQSTMSSVMEKMDADSHQELLPLVTAMHKIAELQPLCHNSLFRSVKHLYRSSPMGVPPQLGCLLIAVCLPKPNILNLEERVTVAWKTFQNIGKQNSYDCAYNLLLLGASLAKLNRFHDAAHLLQRFVTASQLKETDLRAGRVQPLFKKVLSMKDFVDFLQERDPSLLNLAQQWPRTNKIIATRAGKDYNHSVKIYKTTISLLWRPFQDRGEAVRRQIKEDEKEVREDVFGRISAAETRQIFAEDKKSRRARRTEDSSSSSDSDSDSDSDSE